MSTRLTSAATVAILGVLLALPGTARAASTYIVDTTSDANLTTCNAILDNDCSLRGAINNANAASTPGDTIIFSASDFSSLGIILLTADLPGLTDGGDTIDATGRGVLIDAVNMAPNPAFCLSLFSGHNTIIGLQLARCSIAISVVGTANTVGPGNVVFDSGTGILVNGTGNTLRGNKIGTNVAGTAIHPQGGNTTGVSLIANLNTVGGSEPGDANLISGNTTGLVVTSTGGSNTVQGNYIGSDVTGVFDLGNTTGVLLQGPNNVIGGTAAGQGNVISGNESHGIHIQSDGNRINGNYVGTTASGTDDLGNAADGIRVTGGEDNCIGGIFVLSFCAPATGGGNVISGNEGNGVAISGAGAIGNVVLANSIGTAIGGTAVLPNTGNGVLVTSGATFNGIGGADTGAGNVISGNGANGIEFDEAGSGNAVRGNYIGTDATGNADLGNGQDGVLISASINGVIGGTDAASRNVISGNQSDGVALELVASSGNLVQGNYIGTNAAGTADLGNGANGVLLNGADLNTVGGASSAAGNVISGNFNGVVIMGASATGNVINNNYIGTAADGTSPLGNTVNGVQVSASASGNIIGGSSPGNTIAFNGGDGISILSGTSNTIEINSIHANAALGIDLAPDGVTPNDPGDGDSGANNLQNSPVLTGYLGGGFTTLFGNLDSVASTPFIIRVFSSYACDPSGYGEGAAHVATFSVSTNASGEADFSEVIPAPPPGSFLTATARISDPTGDTSEFSNCMPAEDDDDDDNDGFTDEVESGTPLCTSLGDDDGDGVLNDGCPGGPAQAGPFSEAQFNIGTGHMDPCGNDGWPADLWDQPPLSANKITVQDLTAFIAPVRRLGTSPGDASFSSRWDLVPGKGIFSAFINVQDMTALVTLAPPMLNGAHALNGPTCPFPP